MLQPAFKHTQNTIFRDGDGLCRKEQTCKSLWHVSRYHRDTVADVGGADSIPATEDGSGTYQVWYVSAFIVVRIQPMRSRNTLTASLKKGGNFYEKLWVDWRENVLGVCPGSSSKHFGRKTYYKHSGNQVCGSHLKCVGRAVEETQLFITSLHEVGGLKAFLKVNLEALINSRSNIVNENYPRLILFDILIHLFVAWLLCCSGTKSMWHLNVVIANVLSVRRFEWFFRSKFVWTLRV